MNANVAADQVPKPGHVSTPLTEPYWEAANNGVLLLQNCRDCENVQHYPRNICVRCWSHNLDWKPATGIGTVWTFTIVSIPGHPGWNVEVPYVLALVELAEGPRLMTNIIGCDPNDVAVGQEVVLTPIRHAKNDQTLLQFTPAFTQSNFDQ
jgi:uncharacterized protein